MRFIRSYVISGWLILVLITALGFAAFNAGGNSAPVTTTAPDAPVVREATARVSAFVLAEALTFKLDLPDRIDPPQLDVRMGPDALTRTRIRVGATTTTTTTAPPTTTTEAPTTTRAPATTTTAPPATTTTAAAEQTTTTTPFVPSEGVEQWRGLVASYFPPEYVDQALAVMQCESRGDPGATNPHSGAAGLFQFMPRTWAWASAEAGFDGTSPYDATANVASAAWLAQYSLNQGAPAWSHWTCKP